MVHMMNSNGSNKVGHHILAAFLGASLIFFSGCALLWLGAGGAGGYLIRKGEEGGSSANKESVESSKESSTRRATTY
jgi:hypothetical protein